MSQQGPSVRVVLASAFLGGAGTMTVELAAVRLIAPWYGTSAAVWTNVIGVILLALAVGYLVGARLSRGPSPGTWLGRALLLASIFTVWLPFGAGPVCELFLPSGLALDEAAGLLRWGSLGTSILLFLPPAVVLGLVGPLSVELVMSGRGGHAGDAGGRVLAASTLGSLVGTFGTTHVLVPGLGIDMTFWLAAGALALPGILILNAGDGRSRASAALVLLAVPGPFLAQSSPPTPRAGWKLIDQVQSPYQVVRVVELPAEPGQSRGLRYLQVNESFDSFQSVGSEEKGLLGGGLYYDHFVPPAWWSRREGPWRVLVLGLGAGTAVRVLEGCLPPGMELSTVGVELDPVVVEVGRQWFGLEDDRPERRAISDLDARAALRALEPGSFDQVILDCYANAVEIPPHLSTVEFFNELQGVLRDGGWITLNAAGFGLEDPVVQALASSLAEGVQERILATRVPFSRNCMLHARRGNEPPEPGSRSWQVPHSELARTLSPLELPGAWSWVAPGGIGGTLLTDDHSPMERLQASSIEAGRRRWVAD